MKRWTFGIIIIIAIVSIVIIYKHDNVVQMPITQKPLAINQDLQTSFSASLIANVKKSGKMVTYSITVKGNPGSDLQEFRKMASETLNDARGWVRAGVWFREVSSGGDFNLTLSEAKYMTNFSSVCSVDWSCRVGSSVIINDNRWTSATDSWNEAGGNLRDYRHMVINHEVGHFLGHTDNVPVCSGVGKLAPLMQQQSMSLRGCKFNPWPLEGELWTRV